MRNSRHSSLLAATVALAMGSGMTAALLGPASRSNSTTKRQRAASGHNTPEIEAWNEAVEKRRAEKKARKPKATP